VDAPSLEKFQAAALWLHFLVLRLTGATTARALQFVQQV